MLACLKIVACMFLEISKIFSHDVESFVLFEYGGLRFCTPTHTQTLPGTSNSATLIHVSNKTSEPDFSLSWTWPCTITNRPDWANSR